MLVTPEDKREMEKEGIEGGRRREKKMEKRGRERERETEECVWL